MNCIRDTCKKADELAIKFVDSIDTTVQEKIEKNIKAGELIESTLKELTNKQNELRDEIDDRDIELTLDNLEALVKMPVISSMIKDVFTYYYTYILDLIPSEEKEGMTDTTVDIQDLDISIKLMYCIELVCNPEDYVLNYQMNDKYCGCSNKADQLKKMIAAINAGFTLYITNYLHSWKINKKTMDKFSSVGRDVLIVKNNELYMSSGKKYVCITGCNLTALKTN